MGTKRAKRRRRDRKREKREAKLRPRPASVLAGASARPGLPTRPRVDPLARDSPGDQIARDLREDDEGGAAIREPRRPKPRAPLGGAAELEPPPREYPADAVAEEL